MAEILLRVEDKSQDEMAPKAGDVVCVCPDGWPWSKKELSNPAWVIIKLPGLDVSAFSDLLSSDTNGKGEIIRRRARTLNLTTSGVKTALSSLEATDRSITLETAGKRNVLLAARESKPPITPIVRLG